MARWRTAHATDSLGPRGRARAEAPGVSGDLGVVSTVARNQGAEGRNLTLDALKLVLAVMVVAVHTGPFGTHTPILATILEQGVFRMAVPVFLIINGYYLHAAVVSGRAWNWIRRILLIYGLWMVIYLPAWAPKLGEEASAGLAVLRYVLLGYFHLWYLPAAAAGAAVLILVSGLPTGLLLVLAALLYAAGLGVQDIRVWHLHPFGLSIAPLEAWTSRNFLFFGFPFLTAGFLLARDGRVPGRATALALVAAGLTIVIAESLVNASMAPDGTYDILIGLTVLAPAVFLAAMAFRRPAVKLWAGRLAEAVYLVHPWFITLCREARLRPDETFLATIALSLAAGAVLLALLRRMARSPA